RHRARTRPPRGGATPWLCTRRALAVAGRPRLLPAARIRVGADSARPLVLPSLLDGREPVDADGVSLRDVRVEAAVAHLLLDPAVVLRALGLEAHQRHAVAARVGDPLD